MEYFYQPFVMDNELKLEVDITMEQPLGVYKIGGEDTDILDEEEFMNTIATERGRKQLKRSGKSLTGKDFVSDELL